MPQVHWTGCDNIHSPKWTRVIIKMDLVYWSALDPSQILKSKPQKFQPFTILSYTPSLFIINLEIKNGLAPIYDVIVDGFHELMNNKTKRRQGGRVDEVVQAYSRNPFTSNLIQ